MSFADFEVRLGAVDLGVASARHLVSSSLPCPRLEGLLKVGKDHPLLLLQVLDFVEACSHESPDAVGIAVVKHVVTHVAV